MTIIAAYRDNNTYWIASDSISSSGEIVQEYGSKIIKQQNYYVGFAGSFRLADIIQESSSIPDIIIDNDDLKLFRDRLYEELTDKAKAKKEAEDNDILCHPIYLIIICRLGIFGLDGYYQLIKYKEYHTTGCGRDIALGSLYNSKRNKQDGKTAVTTAVRAAAKHHAYCGGRIYTARVEGK